MLAGFCLFCPCLFVSGFVRVCVCFKSSIVAEDKNILEILFSGCCIRFFCGCCCCLFVCCFFDGLVYSLVRQRWWWTARTGPSSDDRTLWRTCWHRTRRTASRKRRREFTDIIKPQNRTSKEDKPDWDFFKSRHESDVCMQSQMCCCNYIVCCDSYMDVSWTDPDWACVARTISIYRRMRQTEISTTFFVCLFVLFVCLCVVVFSFFCLFRLFIVCFWFCMFCLFLYLIFCCCVMVFLGGVFFGVVVV